MKITAAIAVLAVLASGCAELPGDHLSDEQLEVFLKGHEVCEKAGFLKRCFTSMSWSQVQGSPNADKLTKQDYLDFANAQMLYSDLTQERGAAMSSRQRRGAAVQQAGAQIQQSLQPPPTVNVYQR